MGAFCLGPIVWEKRLVDICFAIFFGATKHDLSLYCCLWEIDIFFWFDLTFLNLTWSINTKLAISNNFAWWNVKQPSELFFLFVSEQSYADPFLNLDLINTQEHDLWIYWKFGTCFYGHHYKQIPSLKKDRSGIFFLPTLFIMQNC